MLPSTALMTFLAGCASPKEDPIVVISTAPRIDVAIVSRTLQTYKVGQTTFMDFKKDAGLSLVERPDPASGQRSYLNPQPSIFDRLKTEKVYAAPAGSPWKIYETGNSFTLDHGKYTETHKFVVGDINKPISILAFDREGNLTSISPVR